MECVVDLDEIELKVKSNPRYLAVIRALAVFAAEQVGFDSQNVEDLKLAVDEACANVIRHAYKGETDNDIRIKFMSRDGWFHVIVEDSGVKATPGCLRERSLDELCVGGLGLHFMKKAFQVIKFDDKNTAGNRLILSRKLKDQGQCTDNTGNGDE